MRTSPLRNSHLVTVACLFLYLAPAAHPAVLFVSTNGQDSASGTSWANAKRSVTSALQAASGASDIWLSRGMYSEHLVLKPGIRIFGGFAGNETDLAQRDWHTNSSVIWGNTNKVVVLITNAGPNTALDGLVIGGGIGIHGGGVSVVASAPVLANNTIRNNITDGAGAGISVWGFYLLSSTEWYHPVLTNNIIVDNQSINDEGDGAGIAVVGSSPLIAWNVIARNTATRNGGGIACWRHSLPVIANNFIEGNSASFDEGTASLGGGGIFASATDLDGRPIAFAISAPVIINNVIAANGGRAGGGITVIDSTLGAATIANNSITANNGAGVYWANTWPTNINNIVAFNTRGFERGIAGSSDAEIRINDVYGNTGLGAPANYVNTSNRFGVLGNFQADPKFANAAIGDFHLQPNSPCVDAGTTLPVASGEFDIDRQSRTQGPGLDLGADESDGKPHESSTPVVYVAPNGNDSDGRTWATAKRTVAGGVQLASLSGGEVWVAQGTYPEHLVIPAFVHLFGGFAGAETARVQRNPAQYPTILDGAGTPAIVYFRNSGFRVSTLDGFVLQNGGLHTGGDAFHPDLTKRFGARGGAIYCRVGGPEIVGNTVRSNSIGSPFMVAESYGGGLYTYLGHALVCSNTFLENEVLTQMDGNGGGIFCRESMALIEANLLASNHALNGAAIYAERSELTVSRNTVVSNALYRAPAPVYMGSGSGALYFQDSPSLLVKANLVHGNTADVGAGIYVNSCAAASLFNNVITDNYAFDFSGFGQGGMGAGIYFFANINSTGASLITQNTLVGNVAPPTFLDEMGGGIALTLLSNTVTIANNIIAENSSGIWRDWRTTVQPILLNNCFHNPTNCISCEPDPTDYLADPRFEDLPGRNLQLRPDSPCIDTACELFSWLDDVAGTPRPLDGNGDGSGFSDIGAYEYASPTADTDSDSVPDSAELVAGTDPTNPDSKLSLTVNTVVSTQLIGLSWPSVPGRTYHVQQRAALASAAAWQDFMDPLSGTGNTIEVQLPLSPTNSFYRLSVTHP